MMKFYTSVVCFLFIWVFCATEPRRIWRYGTKWAPTDTNILEIAFGIDGNCFYDTLNVDPTYRRFRINDVNESGNVTTVAIDECPDERCEGCSSEVFPVEHHAGDFVVGYGWTVFSMKQPLDFIVAVWDAMHLVMQNPYLTTVYHCGDDPSYCNSTGLTHALAVPFDGVERSADGIRQCECVNNTNSTGYQLRETLNSTVEQFSYGCDNCSDVYCCPFASQEVEDAEPFTFCEESTYTPSISDSECRMYYWTGFDFPNYVLPGVSDDDDDDGGGDDPFAWWNDPGIMFLIIGLPLIIVGALICVVTVIIICILTGKPLWKKLSRVVQILKTDDIELILAEEKVKNSQKVNVKSSGTPNIQSNASLFTIKVSDLQIKEKIGEGGGDAVCYKCVWRGNIVAYKCFRINEALEEDRFTSFEKEAQFLCNLRFPYILRFYGVTMEKNRIGLVMEFCQNGDLAHFLQDYKSRESKPYDYEKKMKMLHQVSTAMGLLHSMKVIHRDLKLENVLVDEKEDTKLMDFGLSRVDDDKTKTRRVGTPIFIAPEVVRGEYSFMADVFSFGMLMYIVLTERYQPYSDKSRSGTKQSTMGIEILVSQDPKCRPSFKEFEQTIPEKVRELVEVCWSDLPSKRKDFVSISAILKSVLEKDNDEEQSEKKGLKKTDVE